MGPIAQLERGVEMPVLVGLHQVDGVVIATAAQEREEVSHPVGLAKPEYVDIELGRILDVADEERDMAELVRHDTLGREALARECITLERRRGSSLRVRERDHV